MTKYDPKLSEALTAHTAPRAMDWFEAYYQPAEREKVKLRNLDPLEQMYAYFEA